MSENGEIYTAAKNFTLPPAVTAVTNSTSENTHRVCYEMFPLHPHTKWIFKPNLPVIELIG